MKILLKQLDAEVGAIATRLWPAVRLATEFSPLIDLQLGDVGSDLAVRLAQNLRLKPDEIAARICAEWTPPSGVAVNILNGFINLRFSSADPEVFTEEPYEQYCRERLAIVAAPFSKSASHLAELRLCCGAIAQLLIAKHLGIEASLILGGEVLPLDTTAASLLRSVLQKLTVRRPQGAAVTESCKEFSNVTLWIAPHALQRDEFVAFCRSVEGRGGRLRVVGPAAPWLDFRFHEETLEGFATWDDESLAALLWYLSQGSPAADIDFSVVRSAERANISWFWKSTCQRADHVLQPEPLFPSSHTENFEISPIVRRLGMRASYLRTFFVQAAVDGQLQIFMEALSDTLVLFNRIFNDPAFRIRQSEGRLEAVENKIIAGAHRSLSDSINLCDFFEGKRYGSHARTPHQTNRTIVGDYE